uniref:Uncharacterized protein n=1 Tax=Trypanosoma congolense (strain IL3000) TaxID=1068625 RepID=G0UX14_TRYCI|nr:conserved hypothetical protein [Trypanosoma congolense IL3000]
MCPWMHIFTCFIPTIRSPLFILITCRRFPPFTEHKGVCATRTGMYARVLESTRSRGSWRLRLSASLEKMRCFIGELLGYCDVTCDRGHEVDGNVWYADRYLYPNHWQPGSGVHARLVDDGDSYTWLNAFVASALLPVFMLMVMFLVYVKL